MNQAPKPEPHAITRARERYGIELTVADLTSIERRVKAGEGVLVRDHEQENSRRWLVKVGAVTVIACIARHDARVVTILPSSYDTPKKIDGASMKKAEREIRRKDHKARRGGHRHKRAPRPKGGRYDTDTE